MEAGFLPLFNYSGADGQNNNVTNTLIDGMRVSVPCCQQIELSGFRANKLSGSAGWLRMEHGRPPMSVLLSLMPLHVSTLQSPFL